MSAYETTPSLDSFRGKASVVNAFAQAPNPRELMLDHLLAVLDQNPGEVSEQILQPFLLKFPAPFELSSEDLLALNLKMQHRADLLTSPLFSGLSPSSQYLLLSHWLERAPIPFESFGKILRNAKLQAFYPDHRYSIAQHYIESAGDLSSDKQKWESVQARLDMFIAGADLLLVHSDVRAAAKHCGYTGEIATTEQFGAAVGYLNEFYKPKYDAIINPADLRVLNASGLPDAFVWNELLRIKNSAAAKYGTSLSGVTTALDWVEPLFVNRERLRKLDLSDPSLRLEFYRAALKRATYWRYAQYYDVRLDRDVQSIIDDLKSR